MAESGGCEPLMAWKWIGIRRQAIDGRDRRNGRNRRNERNTKTEFGKQFGVVSIALVVYGRNKEELSVLVVGMPNDHERSDAHDHQATLLVIEATLLVIEARHCLEDR